MPWFVWVLLCAAVLFCALWVYLVCPRLFCRPQMHVITACDYAHRGLHDAENNVFENTLPAFRAAMAQGVGSELDVRLTSDGVPVVFHDSTLKRLFGPVEKVCDMTLDKLRSFRFPDGTKIPTLEEVLQEVAGACPLLIELKTENDVSRLGAAVTRLLDKYKGVYCVESFDPLALRWFRKHRPKVARGQLLTKFKPEDADVPKALFFAAENLLSGFLSRPDFISYDCLHRENFSLRFAKKLFRFPEFNWTVKDMKTYLKLKKDGVLCIFEEFVPRRKR